MDIMLIVITATSLAVAAAASLISWRVVRESRARSRARIAALAADIGADGDTAETPASPRASGSLERVPPVGVPVEGAPHMFASSLRGESANHRLAPAFALGGLAVAAVVGTLLLAGSTGDASAPASRTPRPLELLSLRHAQRDGTTTITGLARNPPGAAPAERVTVVVFFFDGSGAFLTSARAPLDFSRLAAGEESPFHVSVPTPPGVNRYRVSFRLAEGGIVPHVDRREAQR